MNREEKLKLVELLDALIQTGEMHYGHNQNYHSWSDETIGAAQRLAEHAGRHDFSLRHVFEMLPLLGGALPCYVARAYYMGMVGDDDSE